MLAKITASNKVRSGGPETVEVCPRQKMNDRLVEQKVSAEPHLAGELIISKTAKLALSKKTDEAVLHQVPKRIEGW